MNQQETRKGPPPSSQLLKTDSDTTTGSQTEQQNGNKRNETDLEEKENGKGDSLFFYTVVLWIYEWTWFVKVHQICTQLT